MPSVWQALQRGESVRERRLQLARAHELFLGERPEITESTDARRVFEERTGVRRVVFDSWLRAGASAIDPDRGPTAPVFTASQLLEERATQPIGRVIPILERLLLEQAKDAGFIVALGDAGGRLLWVDGDQRTRSAAEDMGFAAGVDWSEAAIGTSAPGSALQLQHTIQVLGAEHYNRLVHQWSCTAAPVRDPSTGSLIGVIDVTGGDDLAAPHIIPMIEATLAAVSAELRLESIRRELDEERATSAPRRSRRSQPELRPRLMVLGRNPAVLEHGERRSEVSGRHAEIMLALATTPRGLSASELAEAVYGERASTQTLRAEMVRLRRWIDDERLPIHLESRPYRLTQDGTPLTVDALELLSAISRGAHRVAFAAYEGEVLPGSQSPLAESVRQDVDGALRESMLQDATPEVLFGYAQQWARDDAEVWETLLRILPPLSPKRSRVVSRLTALAAV